MKFIKNIMILRKVKELIQKRNTHKCTHAHVHTCIYAHLHMHTCTHTHIHGRRNVIQSGGQALPGMKM